jgi:hypothetical protein
MTDYSAWTVHEFVTNMDVADESLPALESALRRAVIRESTISTVTVTTTEHYDELCRPTDPDRICTMSSTYAYSQWVPEGEYLLVKKEKE